MISRFAKLLFPCLLIFLSGCYEQKVKEAADRLKTGMTKAEMDQVTEDLKFIKEQSVMLYPNTAESRMKGIFRHDKKYERLHPEDLIDKLTFDGNIKVYSYFVREERAFANPTTTHYLAVFHNQVEDKVIGWGLFSTHREPRIWDDKF
jgi:hypothetical protein